MFEKLRVWFIHKLKGVIPEPPPIITYNVVPQKFSAKMMFREGENYAPEIVQKMLSYQLADALADNGFINFSVCERTDGLFAPVMRAELLAIKKEIDYENKAEEHTEGCSVTYI